MARLEGDDATAAATGSENKRKQSDIDSPVRRSLANGLSQRRFRQILAETSRRYGSRTRLADDDDPGVGGGSVRLATGTGSPHHLTQFLAEKPRIPVNAGSGQPDCMQFLDIKQGSADDPPIGVGSVRLATGTGSPHHLTQFLAEKQRISLSRERRAARTMAVVMGAFVLCWLPFFLMYVSMSFCPSCRRDTDPRAINLVVWLGYVNSTLNPLIYTVFNVDFRRAFSQLLQPRCRRPDRHVV